MLALLFPGQASQAVGMGVDLIQASQHARDLFALADVVTGLPITRLCAEGPLDRLTQTDVAQPAVVTTSLAALAVLREQEPGLDFVATAGHSVGELAAYVAAGALDEQAALLLVHARAQAMAAACAAVDGSMAAVIGLDIEALRDACLAASQPGSSVELANLNAPGQLIVSGTRDALERLGPLARAAGARRLLALNVGGPFHSIYMRRAADALARAVEAAEFRNASVPVVLNASAQAARDTDALREELRVQVYSPVRWIESLHALAALGCDRFLELGPGTVIGGLVKRTLPDARTASLGSMADLPGVRSLLLEHAG